MENCIFRLLSLILNEVLCQRKRILFLLENYLLYPICVKFKDLQGRFLVLFFSPKTKTKIKIKKKDTATKENLIDLTTPS